MRTAEIRRLVRTDQQAASKALATLLRDQFQIEARAVTLNNDRYSLNSLNGFFETGQGAFFFKFHQEEGEEQMRGEYYRADLLQREGLPVDMPVMASNTPGEQILIYRRRSDQRFSDVLFALDSAPDRTSDAALHARAVAAERDLNTQLVSVAKRTLHTVSADQVHREAIHRLFYERLVDLPGGTYPGGRYRSFYIDQTFELPGATLSWAELCDATLVLNGQRMRMTLREIFDQAARLLHPGALTNAGGIVAHGDAHNANVWFEDTGEAARLVYFDPAFAGEHVPALLAEVKATFHNVFAHPLWLYDPALAQDAYTAQVRYTGGTLFMETDWQPSALRRDLLTAKAEAYWAPFLEHLRAENLLPGNWKQVLRAALAMCPALVTNLRASPTARGPVASAIGLYVTIAMGSEAEDGPTLADDFLASIAPR